MDSRTIASFFKVRDILLTEGFELLDSICDTIFIKVSNLQSEQKARLLVNTMKTYDEQDKDAFCVKIMTIVPELDGDRESCIDLLTEIERFKNLRDTYKVLMSDNIFGLIGTMKQISPRGFESIHDENFGKQGYSEVLNVLKEMDEQVKKGTKS